MKTKTSTKKTKTKSGKKVARPAQWSASRAVRAWAVILAVAILAVAYQLGRTDRSDGLSVTAPVGSLAREDQLDNAEIQQESAAMSAYGAQQVSNVSAADEAVGQLPGATDEAIR